MQRGSLKALLAVLAVAGYQNRDKIAELLKGMTERPQPGSAGMRPGQGQAPGQGQDYAQGEAGQSRASASGSGMDEVLDRLRSGGLGSVLGGSSIGSILNGGLTDLLDQFRQAGQEKKAESWVKPGANDPIDDNDLAAALGPEVLRDIAERTGLSEEEVLKRLSKNLPDAVDGLTPDGRVPPATA